MHETSTDYTFAIVGLGPRGGYALECLVEALGRSAARPRVAIRLFEETGYLGNGAVYAQDQPDTNWINITERVLDLPERKRHQFGPVEIPAFPSYFAWADLIFDEWPRSRVDTFPPRSKIGRYLQQRFLSLTEPLVRSGIASLTSSRVDRVTYRDGQCTVITAAGESYPVDEVLLTVGHQPTRPDDQIIQWRSCTQHHPHLQLHEEPYPVTRLDLAGAGTDTQRVAIRGYGLAMLDVVRALAQRFGSFSTTDSGTLAKRYELDSGSRLLIAPFSLDGLTMGPKPFDPSIDAQFEPTGKDLETLSEALGDRSAQAEAENDQFLIDAMAPLIAGVFGRLEVESAPTPAAERAEGILRRWLSDAAIDHPSLMDRGLAPERTLELMIGMAAGAEPVTLDYCAGQVWRHCQPVIYQCLSHSALPDDAIAETIALDERMKRFSFGPPVESLQQLLALHDAGVLDLGYLADPDIHCGADGWTLTNGSGSFVATTMVNSVLDGPQILNVESPLLQNLLRDDVIQPVHDQLGILTDPKGYVLSALDDSVLPIAVLGRLAKGTVIGVDAILECFGDRPMAWAEEASARAVKGRDS